MRFSGLLSAIPDRHAPQASKTHGRAKAPAHEI